MDIEAILNDSFWILLQAAGLGFLYTMGRYQFRKYTPLARAFYILVSAGIIAGLVTAPDFLASKQNLNTLCTTLLVCIVAMWAGTLSKG